MSVLYLIITVVSSACTNILSSFFIRKNEVHENSAFIYNLIASFFLIIAWGIYFIFEGDFNPTVLIYSGIFSLCFAATNLFLYLAIQCGMLSFTTLLLQMSLVFTAIWGILFWNSKISLFTILGFVLITISLAFCIIKKEKDKKFNFKWLVFAILACLGNTGCSVIVKQQQIDYNNQFGGQMMFFAMIFVCMFNLILYLAFKKNVCVSNLKGSWWVAIFSALANFALNLFVILLAGTTMSPTIIYPTIAVGSLALNVIYSLFVNKEKLTIIQMIGLIIGAVSIAFLSI